ncbi:hypothetical protein [uncultured Neglectibacter sp.]|uniref:hypothetical protein n=1 Tax=uncultured Neglectibacter sp. TaxID=1924108 RepID=UPI0034DDE4E3
MTKKKKQHFSIFMRMILTIFLFVTFTGCREKESNKLRILVDLRDVDFVSSEPENLRRALKSKGELDPDTLEIELLPTEEAERTVRLRALRTEIMSGGGPDVFLMTCNFSGWRSGRGIYRPNSGDGKDPFEQERLFSDVEKCMENHFFFPLDNFFEKAKYFDPDMILPAVLEAGKTDEGQMVLPITFTFPIAVYQKDIVQPQGELPTSWQAAADSSNRAAQKAYGVAAWNQFSDIFPRLSDTSGWGLTVTKEELTQRVKEAVKLCDFNLLTMMETAADNLPKLLEYDEYINYAEKVAASPFPAEEFGGFLSERSIDYYNISFWSPGIYDYRWETKKCSQIIEPIYNTAGGVTAGITTYASINRNTKHPEEAFRVLDTLFCIDVQNGQGSTPEAQSDMKFQTLALRGSYGIPSRNDLLKDHTLAFQMEYSSRMSIVPGPNEELFSEYTALRSEVTHARFYGALDQELQTMYEACLEAENDEEIEKIVSQSYDTMLMILAES